VCLYLSLSPIIQSSHSFRTALPLSTESSFPPSEELVLQMDSRMGALRATRKTLYLKCIKNLAGMFALSPSRVLTWTVFVVGMLSPLASLFLEILSCLCSIVRICIRITHTHTHTLSLCRSPNRLYGRVSVPEETRRPYRYGAPVC
jgi:hypothetical protein